VCKSLSSEESWGSSEEGYQYRARYTLPPPPEAAPVTKSADPRAKNMAPNEETTTAPAAGSPIPPLGALLPRVTRSVYDEEEEEEEELVPSVPLASEDSDLGESGDFESYSDAEEEEETTTGATKTTDDDVDIVTLK
jgi:hypothetical protein